MELFFLFKESKKEWSAPGEGVSQKGAEKSIAQHPGVDHESDSEEEDSGNQSPKSKKKKKTPVEPEPEFQVTEIQNEVESMETSESQ